jgi:Na+/proline symporter
MIAGLALVLALVLGKHDPLWNLNAGFVALAVNFAVTIVVALLTPAGGNARAPLAAK